MLERTLVFVDTSYLLASFYNSWETGARAQLEIDLPEVVAVLRSMVENQLGQPIVRQNWYDGIPDSGPHRYQRALRTCDGVQLRAGQLIEWGERRSQKAVDTRLVADMVLAAVRRDVTDIVLVSGDADMIPGVQEAVTAGIRVHLYGFGWESMSAALRHACDTTTILDPRLDFEDCMQLEVLEGPLAPTVRERASEEEHDGAAGTDADMEVLGSEDFEDEQPTRYVPAVVADEEDEDPIIVAKPTPAPQVTDNSGVEVSASRRSTVSETTITRGQDGITITSKTEEATESTTRPVTPNPSMMAPRRKLRSRYVPLPNEVWTSAGFQTPFDVGQQYAIWWYENAATPEQRDSAHLLSGGGLPPEIDRPLLQFACETLHEYTLSENQRVNLRDGFHSGIRGILINGPRN